VQCSLAEASHHKEAAPNIWITLKHKWVKAMENSIYLGLSRQMVLRTNMDIIANNVANMNTSGYRAQNTLFEEYLSDPGGAEDTLSFVYDKGQFQTTESGPVTVTGNPLDIALAGPGFMGVESKQGEPVFSRAGSMTLDAEGTLTTAAGLKVRGDGGGYITIPQGATEIKIDEKGVVSTQNGPVGQIMLAEFENIQQLEPLGNNTYKTDAQSLEAVNTRVMQGSVEGSNVQPVLEMTRMIDTLRSYQSTQNMLQSENDRLRGAIQKLLRAN